MEAAFSTSAGPVVHRARPAVADAMIRFPKLCRPGTTVDQARQYLRDDHVHALLVVDDGVLVAVVERADLPGAPLEAPAHTVGCLAGRVVAPDDDLASVAQSMTVLGRRRFAVVDEHGRLVGLLCRKRSGQGFCSDDGVAARSAALTS